MTETERLLRDLVAFDTTSARSNLPLMQYVQDYCITTALPRG